MTWYKILALALGAALGVTGVAGAQTGPPAQKLPSALVVLPLIDSGTNGSDGVSRDTRVEVVNLTANSVDLQCFYVDSTSCNEIGFFLTMTPYQPLSWLASEGYNDIRTFSRVPGFYGRGEMKCAVIARLPQVEFHNALQARAVVFGSDGTSVGYSATAFRRLTDGDYTGAMPLDGVTYEQCPDRLHFTLLGQVAGQSESELILVPCTQDLLTQTPSQPNVSLTIINEFEQSFSAAIKFKCYDRRKLTDVASTLDRTALGSDTAHVIVRGGLSLIGLGIDQFTFNGAPLTAANDPSFQGGRSATVTFP
ncbi:MAG TPA: hypothetical protein VMW17_16020 [Candidatus Binatia bacterium]|nr:hypothetical protein [Candidatus Binatia bacterium]